MDVLFGKTEPPPAENIWDAAARTGFINVEIAAGRVAGLESVYKKTISLFRRQALKDGKNLVDYLARGDMRNFAVIIHGMKSSLATIGAMSMAESAAELEAAAKRENRRCCEERLPPFLKKLRDLEERLISIAGDEETPDGQIRSSGNNDMLRECVSKALDAADTYNSDAGLSAIAGLLKYDFGKRTNDLLRDAEAAFRMFEFDAASKYLGGIAGIF